MAEWTQKEQAQAQEQVIAETRKIGGTYYTTAREFACQRNRALAALKVIVAHEDAAALELKRDLDMPDIELPWMKQAIAGIAACEGK